ncbi:MAG TPA: hypothetical protein VG502_06615 [Flexivirga sp.]|uniref:hypothetical protein n=1 Tax=Flexivirga sp. TaxID=1962927 RepID=UPI002C2845C3|nr:hypothetical protein [Flexivirga sp.]HWC21956.1 hypothetical protein [Flexivirga sp.]
MASHTGMRSVQQRRTGAPVAWSPRSDRLRRLLRNRVTGLSVIAALPVVVAALRQTWIGWIPEGDDAIVVTRIHDVFSGNPPLLGMRSTSNFFDVTMSNHHPGPLEFYLDAPISAALGYSGAGIVIAVAVVNIACVVGTVVLAHRMRGLRTAIPVVGALLLSQWALGPDVLARPLNPCAGTLPLLLMLVATWSVLDRDPQGLWVTLLAGSYAAQTELAFCPLVVAACGTALIVVACRTWARRSRFGGIAGMTAPRRRTVLTAVLIVLAWLPSIIELFVLHPNNLQLVFRYASGPRHGGGTASAGVSEGFAYVVGNLSPTQFGRFDTTITTLPTGTAVAIGMCVLVLLVVALAAGPRLPHTAASRGCWIVLIAVVAESFALSAKPDSGPGTFWVLPVLVIPPLAYAVLVLRFVEVVRTLNLERLDARRFPHRLVPRATAVLAALVVVLATAGAKPPSADNSDRAKAVSDVVLTYLHAHSRPGTTVRVDSYGLQSWISLAPALGVQLFRHDHPAHYLPSWPYPEETSSWYSTTAPAGSVVVTLADEGSTDQAHPKPGAVAIPLPADSAPGLRLWIDIPPGDRL